MDIVKMSFTQLMLAARNGDLRGVREHLGEAGRRSIYGQTALMLAAFCDNLECARLLLSEAGKQSTKESISFPPEATALMLAAHYNHPEIVELLLPYEQGLTDSEGHMAKWYANNGPRRGDFARVRELLRNEGTNRIHPPQNPGKVSRLREHVNKLTIEIESLRKELFSIDRTQEEEDSDPSSQEVSSLRRQLERCQEINSNLQQTLDQKIKEAELRTTCIVCLTNPKDTLLQPCNHLCVCSICAGRITNQTCPLCRTPIDNTVKVHL